MTKPTFLNSETLIPLGSVMSLIVAIIAGLFWINSQLSSINASLSSIEHKLDMSIQVVNNKIDVQRDDILYLQENGWTYKDQKIWAGELQIANKDIKVPLDIENRR